MKNRSSMSPPNRQVSIPVLFFSLSFILSSCTMYHITTASLAEQMAKTQPQTKFNYIVAPPFFFPGIVKGNNLTEIRVLDKDEKEVVLPMTRFMAVRITTTNGLKDSFYLDTLLIQDSTITGKKSHFIGVNAKPINLNKVRTIEVSTH